MRENYSPVTVVARFGHL